ncbi:unnamed protein product [Echinostoma caproni]|uniref:IRS-type PTB domain-containing protein n=1 Tax=Echinostoma caproni TaxID=27848 RepID=A0A183AEV9_9TREM|nr:unnamed protein product [Echinostoma caproni]
MHRHSRYYARPSVLGRAGYRARRSADLGGGGGGGERNDLVCRLNRRKNMVTIFSLTKSELVLQFCEHIVPFIASCLNQKIKTEAWPTSGDPPQSSNSLQSSISGTNCSTNSTSVGLGGQLIPLAPNGMCTSTGLPLPVNFIPSLASNTFGSTPLLPSTILPTSFHSVPTSEFPSNTPLITFAPGLTVSSSASSLSSSSTLSASPGPISTPVVNGVLTQASSAVTAPTVSSTGSLGEDGMKSCSDRWMLDSPATSAPSDSVQSDTDSMTMMVVDKADGNETMMMLCSRCCGLSTKEDPFLVCKDCGQGVCLRVILICPIRFDWAMYSPSRPNSENTSLENITETVFNRLPSVYPRYAATTNLFHTSACPQSPTALICDSVYGYGGEPIRNLHRNEMHDNSIYPHASTRAMTTYPSTFYVPNSHSVSIPTEISLAEAVMKRPRLSCDSYMFSGSTGNKLFVAPNTNARFPLSLKSASISEKQLTHNPGRVTHNGMMVINSTRIHSIAPSEQAYAQQALASRASLSKVDTLFESKNMKSLLSAINESQFGSVRNISTPTVLPCSQFGYSIAPTISYPEINLRTTTVSITLSSTTGTPLTTSSATIDQASTPTTAHISARSNPSDKDVSTSRLGNGVRATQMAAFKHEPRKRKAQPLTISSVTSLRMTGIKSDPMDSNQVNPESHALITHPSISNDASTIANTSSSSILITSGSDLSRIQSAVAAPRPQSVLVQLTPGPTRTVFTHASSGGISTPNIINGSAAVQRNSFTKNARLNPRRPILPNTLRRPGFQTLHPLHWLTKSPVRFGIQDESVRPPALLSTKTRMQSANIFDSIVTKSLSSNELSNQSIGVVSVAVSKHAETTFTSIDDLLWHRNFFGKSNPQQLVYTLVYLFARTFQLWSGVQLSKLRFGFRSQFTFVLLKPGETTKPIEVFRSASTNRFTAIDSNLFRGDFKSLLFLPRLRLLYAPQLDEDETEQTTDLPIHSDSGSAYPGSSVNQTVNTSESRRYLLDHFEANSHERCLLCYHALYLSKRHSTGTTRDVDPYFLAWEPNPTPNKWFRADPLEAHGLSMILQTIRTALDCAKLMHRKSALTLNPIDFVTTKTFGYPGESIELKSHGDDSPLNLVIREQRTCSNNFSGTTKSHPTCLDYWPELTERARQSPWQCSDCKTCTVCQGKGYESELLICDACDKGFHPECHVPNLEEPVDRSLPWVCAACQKEGYSVAIGTLPGAPDNTFPTLSGHMDMSLTHAEAKYPENSMQSDPGLNSMSEAGQASESTKTPLKSTSTEPPTSTTPNQTRTPITDHSPQNDTNAFTSSVKSPIKPIDNLPNTPAHGGPVNSATDRTDSSPEPLSSSASKNHSTINTASTEEHEAHNSVHEVSSSPPSTDPITQRGNGHESCADECNLHPPSLDMAHFVSRPEDIRAWSVEHVRDWLLEEGFHRESEAFFQQEIDGACLLLMKRMDVLTELGIKLGPAVKIYERIKRLQSRCSSPNIMCS